MRQCAPRIVAGNAHLPQAYTHIRIEDRRQLVRMRRIVDLMRRIRKSRDVQRVAFKTDTSAADIRDLRVSYIRLIAAFLRHEVFCHIVCDFVPENTHFRMISVCIRLFRSLAVPHHIFIIGIQRKEHTEFRNLTDII